MTALPPDIQRLWNDMDAADRAADALSERLSDEVFFWRPDGGTRWSVALCLDHLATTNDMYGKAIQAGIEVARRRGWSRRGPLTPGYFGLKFANSLEPPPRRKTPAPGQIQPQPARTRAEILAAYHAAHDVIRHMLKEAATLDVNRATFPNPFIGIVRVKVSSAFYIVAAHDRRHLWQAESAAKAFERAEASGDR